MTAKTPSSSINDANLLAAARGGNTATMRTLLEQGANPDVKDSEGNTPLIIVVRGGARWTNEMVTMLLDHNANIEATDSEGRTALMTVAIAYSKDTAELLLKRGANPDHRDRHGKSAVDILQDNYKASLKKSHGLFNAVVQIAPMMDLLKFWSELHRLQDQMRPKDPPAVRPGPGC